MFRGNHTQCATFFFFYIVSNSTISKWKLWKQKWKSIQWKSNGLNEFSRKFSKLAHFTSVCVCRCERDSRRLFVIYNVIKRREITDSSRIYTYACVCVCGEYAVACRLLLNTNREKKIAFRIGTCTRTYLSIFYNKIHINVIRWCTSSAMVCRIEHFIQNVCKFLFLLSICRLSIFVSSFSVSWQAFFVQQ